MVTEDVSVPASNISKTHCCNSLSEIFVFDCAFNSSSRKVAPLLFLITSFRFSAIKFALTSLSSCLQVHKQRVRKHHSQYIAFLCCWTLFLWNRYKNLGVIKKNSQALKYATIFLTASRDFSGKTVRGWIPKSWVYLHPTPNRKIVVWLLQMWWGASFPSNQHRFFCLVWNCTRTLWWKRQYLLHFWGLYVLGLVFKLGL